MYGGLGGKEGSSSNACKILLSWTQLDVGRHGQLLAVEAVLCPVRVDVAEGREVWELLELGRVGLLEALRVPVVRALGFVFLTPNDLLCPKCRTAEPQTQMYHRIPESLKTSENPLR